MRESVQDPNDELECDLVRVANLHLKVLEDHRHYRSQRKAGQTSIVEVPPEENRGESREIVQMVTNSPFKPEESST